MSSTKPKSIGKPGSSSGRRKQRIPRQSQLPTLELPESIQSLALPLQVRPSPKPSTQQEQQVLDMLWQEYRKSDAVARAAARFEADVHEQQVQQRIEDGFDETEAGEVHRVFNADEFNTTFRRLLQLRLEIRLLRRLGLDQYEADIVHERILTVFGAKVSATKQVMVHDSLRVGSPETQQVQDLKSRGRRRR